MPGPYVPGHASTWARLTPLLALRQLLFAGCGGGGGGGSAVQKLADCLNEQGYDVTARATASRAARPAAPSSRRRSKDDKLTIDDSASQAGTGLADQERTSIEMCTDARFRLHVRLSPIRVPIHCASPRRCEIPNRVRSGRKQP